MGWKPFKKLGAALKKGASKLKSNLKKHGPKLLGLGLGLAIPGVGGLLGKAIGAMTGNAGLGSALHAGFSNIGKGGIKGLLGQAISPLKGRNLKSLLFGGAQFVDTGEETLVQQRTGLFQSDLFKNFAKDQLKKEALSRIKGPSGPYQEEEIPGLLGLSERLKNRNLPSSPGYSSVNQPPVNPMNYTEQQIENYMK